MTSYEEARTKRKQFMTLTSLNLEQFDTLLPIFESIWEVMYREINFDGTPQSKKILIKIYRIVE